MPRLTPRSGLRRIGRRGAGVMLVSLLVAAGAVVLQWVGHRWAGRGATTAGAEWIWASLPLGFTEPLAFWAVRDFELDAVPATAALSLLADEEYVAHLNGRRVGSNRYSPGAAVDRYRVEDLLLVGGNRLAVELRSGHGAGGLLAALDLGGGRPPIVSDGEWRIVRRHHPGLLPGWRPLASDAGDGDVDGGGGAAEAPFSWGRPPVGRWGLPDGVRDRPLATAVVELCAPLAAAASGPAAGRRQVFDWGREVYGYLSLRFEPGSADGSPVGLLLTGAAPRRPLEDPEAAAAVVTVPALPVWTDPVPRRFRYASVAGLPPLAAAEVLPVDPRAEDRLPAPAPAEATPLLGLEVPVHLTPVERAVRRQLDGVAPP